VNLFSTNPPALKMSQVEVDAVTGLMLLVLAATIVSVIVDAIAGSGGFWGLSQANLAWIAGIDAVVLIASRSLIASFQNAGIGASVGFLTRVEVGIATVVGVVMTMVYEVSAAWSGIAGNVSALGVSSGTMAKIGGIIALATVIGQGIQKAFQNWGMGAGVPQPVGPTPAPVVAPTPPVASKK